MVKGKNTKISKPANEPVEKEIISRGRNLEPCEVYTDRHSDLFKRGQVLVSHKHVNGNITFAI